MKKIVLSAIGAVAVLSTGATAAPLNPTSIGSESISNVDQVRLVCTNQGRCFRTRGPRYIQRSYGDDDYYVRRSYGYYDGGPGYYGGGPAYGGYYGGGPSIGFSFGSRGW